MKLPNPRKRGDAYRIELMYSGQRYSCTRDTAKECEQWAAKKLLELKAGVAQSKQRRTMTFYELFERYNAEVAPSMKTAAGINAQFKALNWKVGALAAKQIHEITAEDWSNWRNKRLLEVAPGTVKREISLYSAIFTYAQKELFLIDENPFFKTSKPKSPKSRYRRIEDHEIAAVLKACEYESIFTPTLTKHYVGWAFLFAIETAMRRGEIFGIRRKHVYDDYVHIPDSKTNEKRDVPLSELAKRLISVLDWQENKAIPRTIGNFSKEWHKANSATGIVDLHFHDTRHEAISRMVDIRKMPVEILSKVTGHKDIKTLVNVYYNPKAADIVAHFNSR